jgi:hypothetical protein
MIGSGMPISQSSAPLPKPMVILLCLCRGMTPERLESSSRRRPAQTRDIGIGRRPRALHLRRTPRGASPCRNGQSTTSPASNAPPDDDGPQGETRAAIPPAWHDRRLMESLARMRARLQLRLRRAGPARSAAHAQLIDPSLQQELLEIAHQQARCRSDPCGEPPACHSEGYAAQARFELLGRLGGESGQRMELRSRLRSSCGRRHVIWLLGH